MYLKIDEPLRRLVIAGFKYAAVPSYAKLDTPHNKQIYTYYLIGKVVPVELLRSKRVTYYYEEKQKI